jgi:hypothetical protein
MGLGRESDQRQRILVNLAMVCEFIYTAFALKLAWYRARNPLLGQTEAERRIYVDIL